VTDSAPGITRERRGRGFCYRGPDGRVLRDRDLIDRIRALAIPPAWESVWISTEQRGHLQATGRDARGRKQYRYHPLWREVRDAQKYARVVEFGQTLPRIRRRVDADLSHRGLPREKVLAAVVRLLDTTLMRVGNSEYARLNESFGITTIRNRHAKVDGRTVRFSFRGKSGQPHDVAIDDARLARVVRRCQQLPGQELFGYLDDDDKVHDVGSDDVNEYLEQVAGTDFTAKDFRTWGGTVLAAEALCQVGPAGSDTDAKRRVAEAVRIVASELRNTPAVCRACYIHPAVIDAYGDDLLPCDAIARNPERATLALLKELTEGAQAA